MTTALAIREIFQALAAPFHPSEIKTRNQGGKELSWAPPRVVMNRLDEVLGGENWKDRYTETRRGIKCRILFRLPGSNEWLWKEDGGAPAGMKEIDNDEKSGYSDAFKRAAIKLGVGRYLYEEGVPIYPDQKPVPLQDSLPPEVKPSKKNRHPNNGDSPHGQYASDEQTSKYLDRLKEKIENANGSWSDHWMDPRTGEFPNVKACTSDFMTVFQADSHLVKWLVDTGQIDPDSLEKNGKPGMLGKLAAIVMFRGKDAAMAMANELGDYIVKIFEAKKMAIYRKHPELAPEGFAEELAEANAKADQGDAYGEPLA